MSLIMPRFFRFPLLMCHCVPQSLSGGTSSWKPPHSCPPSALHCRVSSKSRCQLVSHFRLWTPLLLLGADWFQISPDESLLVVREKSRAFVNLFGGLFVLVIHVCARTRKQQKPNKTGSPGWWQTLNKAPLTSSLCDGFSLGSWLVYSHTSDFVNETPPPACAAT